MKIATLPLIIILATTACDSNLQITTNCDEDPSLPACTRNSAEPDYDGDTSKQVILSQGQDHVIPDSTFTESTRILVDGVEMETFEAEGGEVGVRIPDDMRAGRLEFVMEQGSKSYEFTNVIGLSGDDVPLFFGPASVICTDTSFYNQAGELTQGTKACSTPAPECSSDGQTSCLTNASFPAAEASGLASKVVSGSTVAGISGTSSFPAITDVASGVSYGAGGTEFTGTAAGIPATCTSNTQQGCVTDATYQAADLTNLAAGNIKSGVTIAGTAGNLTSPAQNQVLATVTYGSGGTEFTGNVVLPAAGKVLTGNDFGPSSGTTATLTLPAAGDVRSGSSSYGDPGAAVTPSYNPDFPAASAVLDSDTTDGVTGTVTTRGTWNLTSSFPGAGYYSGISNAPAAGDLRRGVAVNGVTGDFPSSTSPLPRYSSNSGANTATTGSDETDLTNFTTQLTSAGTFEFWDSEGVRRTGSGDADITAANVASGVQFENLSITGSFGPDCTGDGETGCLTTATYKSVDTSAITEWDIKTGKTAGGITGSVKTACRNAANSAIYDYDGNTDSIPQTGTTAGSTINWWDTIDNYNDNLDTLPTAQPAGWTADNLCGKELWEDITSDGTCDSAADDCLMRDNVSGLTWSEGYPVTGVSSADTTVTWDVAVDHCNDLSFGGIGAGNWRLPTQMELQQASMHGIRQLGFKGGSLVDSKDNNAEFIADVDQGFWSASSRSYNSGNAWRVGLQSGGTNNYNKSSSYRVLCVSP